MKFQNIALILLTLFSISAHAAPINCTVPNGSGHRYALTGGGYGFCQVETCANPTDEVYKNQCLSAPKVSFLQSNSLVTGSERHMIIKATLTRPSVSGAHVNLSSSASSASLADFQLISAQAQFLAGSTVSEPIIIQLHNNNSSQPNRTISISFANDGSASGLSTTSASPIVIAIADTPAALQPIVAQIKSPSDQSLPASMESSVGSVPMKLTLSRPASQLFPTKLKITIGSQVSSVMLPAKAQSISFSAPLPGVISSPQTLSVSVLGSGISAAVIIGLNPPPPPPPASGMCQITFPGPNAASSFDSSYIVQSANSPDAVMNGGVNLTSLECATLQAESQNYNMLRSGGPEYDIRGDSCTFADSSDYKYFIMTPNHRPNECTNIETKFDTSDSIFTNYGDFSNF
jgi:hypothetical protein